MSKNDIVSGFSFKTKEEYQEFIECAKGAKVFKACGNLDDMWVMCRFTDKQHMEYFIFSLPI